MIAFLGRNAHSVLTSLDPGSHPSSAGWPHPMFLIIAIWGGKRAHYASFKFSSTTLPRLGLMLVAMIAMYVDAGHDRHRLQSRRAHLRLRHVDIAGWQIVGGLQTLPLGPFFASFGVKMPMWPVHTWPPTPRCRPRQRTRWCWPPILLKMGTTASCAFPCRCLPRLGPPWRISCCGSRP